MAEGADRKEKLRRLDASWAGNADAWTEAVRRGLLESRRVATDSAIIEAVEASRPARVLDVGCGEGWLARRLGEGGVAVVGMDGSAELIAKARAAGGGTFLTLSYDELERDPSAAGSGFDAAICNFSLLHDSIGGLLAALRAAVRPGGRLVIQTVHPGVVEGDEGWREETFDRLADLSFESMPWYYRATAGWKDVLDRSGWSLVEAREPADPRTGAPVSLILIAMNPADSPA